MHGWGSVCGCEVQKVPTEGHQSSGSYEPWMVKITLGYVLGPYGDEIILDREVTLDLRQDVHGTLDNGIDPWCSDVKRKGLGGRTLYVAIRYEECPTRPVRAHPIGCACEEVRCEESRIREGYVIKALTELPESHLPESGVDEIEASALFPAAYYAARSRDFPFYRFRYPGRFWHKRVEKPLPICPECPTDPWVVLADVDLGTDGEVCKIDNCRNRRLVVSFADVWWRCAEVPTTPTPTPPPTNAEIIEEALDPIIIAVDPPVLKAGEEKIVIVKGRNFKVGSKVDFGVPTKSRISLKEIESITENEIRVRIKVWANAHLGDRDISVTNPGRPSISTSGLFKIGR